MTGAITAFLVDGPAHGTVVMLDEPPTKYDIVLPPENGLMFSEPVSVVAPSLRLGRYERLGPIFSPRQGRINNKVIYFWDGVV